MKKLVLILLCLVPILTSADESKVAYYDSLVNQLSITPYDTVKVNLYVDLVKKQLADSLDKKTRLNSYSALGDFYTSQPDSMYKYLMAAMEFAERINWHRGIMLSAFNLSRYYAFTYQEDEVVKLGVKVLNNNPDLYTATMFGTTIISIYTQNKQYEKALEYSDLVLNLEGQTDMYKAVAFSYKCDIYQALEQPDSALYYINLSLSLLKNPETLEEHIHKIHSLTQCSKLHENDPETCYYWAKEAETVFEKIKQAHPRVQTLVSSTYANACIKMASLEKLSQTERRKYAREAVKNANFSIESEAIYGGSANYSLTNRKTLHEAYNQLGEYKKAYDELLKYHELYENHFSQESKNKLAAVEKEIEAERYENEIRKKESELKSEKDQQKLFLIALALLIVIAVLLVFYSNARKRASEKLAALNEDLEKANELKNKMLGILNHDLRKPVIILIEYLKFARELPDAMSAEEKRQVEQKSLEMTEELMQSMEELLAWCKSQMSHFKPEFQEVEVADLFKTVDLIPHAKGTIEIQSQPGITLHTDPMYMKTIIRNLTSNAMKAALEAAQPLVRWTVETIGSSVHLSIENNGKLLSDNQKKILLKGADTTTLSAGLGLQIVHDMAKDIHCTIVVETNNLTTIRLIFNP